MMYPNSKIIFANGGDRTTGTNILTATVEQDVEFVFGVGGVDKKDSCSDAGVRGRMESTQNRRRSGATIVPTKYRGTKAKELTISPGQTLTTQKHYDLRT
jgi:hypothetical protein